MNIQVKNVKIYDGLSEETVAFNASIYVDGKKVGDAKNNGRGGANDIDVFTKDGRWNRDLISDMELEAETHTWTYEGETYSHNLDSYIGKLVDDFDEQRNLKRMCRTETLYRIPDETYDEGEYHTMKHKYGEDVKTYLTETYGDGVRIINEEVQ